MVQIPFRKPRAQGSQGPKEARGPNYAQQDVLGPHSPLSKQVWLQKPSLSWKVWNQSPLTRSMWTLWVLMDQINHTNVAMYHILFKSQHGMKEFPKLSGPTIDPK